MRERERDRERERELNITLLEPCEDFHLHHLVILRIPDRNSRLLLMKVSERVGEKSVTGCVIGGEGGGRGGGRNAYILRGYKGCYTRMHPGSSADRLDDLPMPSACNNIYRLPQEDMLPCFGTYHSNWVH